MSALALPLSRSGGWLRLGGLAALLLAWQLAALAAQDTLLPGPLPVAQRLLAECASGALPLHLAATLARVAAAFTLALLLGSALGIWMGRSPRVNAALDGTLVLLLNLPALVTMILCYVWLGLGECAAVLAVALNKLPTVVVTLREGARALDSRLLQMAQVYRLPRRALLLRIVLPQLAPYFMAATRSGLALVWKIVLVVELLGRPNGVGFQLGSYFQFFDIAGVLAYTLAFVAIVLAIETAALRPLEQRLNHWRCA